MEPINQDVEGLYEIITLPDRPEAWCIKLNAPKDDDETQLVKWWDGIVYTYGKVEFDKKNLTALIEHEILHLPKHANFKLTEEQYQEWEILIGKIAINIISMNDGKFNKNGMFIEK